MNKISKKATKPSKEDTTQNNNHHNLLKFTKFRTVNYKDMSKKIIGNKKIILAVIILLVIFFWKFKNLFIVATVNGEPITRMELTDQLTRRFGSQSLDNIINEKLIISTSKQKGINVTVEEVNMRVKQIVDKLQNNVSLTDALAAQGLTESMFKKQIEIQLTIEKLFDKEATVSPQEIKEYISNNSSFYKNATDPAAVKVEVESILQQQKIRDLFDKWFTDVRKNAKINKYL